MAWGDSERGVRSGIQSVQTWSPRADLRADQGGHDLACGAGGTSAFICVRLLKVLKQPADGVAGEVAEVNLSARVR